MKTADRDHPTNFSASERKTLLAIVRNMIPPCRDLGVPGADDPHIFADILKSIDRDLAAIRKALCVVDEMAGGCLAELPEPDQVSQLAEFRAGYPELAGAVESAAARSYYRDDRVMTSIGMEVRPPFPLGYEIEQGDWSLLDPVRERGRIYRDAG